MSGLSWQTTGASRGHSAPPLQCCSKTDDYYHKREFPSHTRLWEPWCLGPCCESLCILCSVSITVIYTRKESGGQRVRVKRNSTFAPPEALVSSYCKAIFGLLFLKSFPYATQSSWSWFIKYVTISKHILLIVYAHIKFNLQKIIFIDLLLHGRHCGGSHYLPRTSDQENLMQTCAKSWYSVWCWGTKDLWWSRPTLYCTEESAKTQRGVSFPRPQREWQSQAQYPHLLPPIPMLVHDTATPSTFSGESVLTSRMGRTLVLSSEDPVSELGSSSYSENVPEAIPYTWYSFTSVFLISY